MGFFLTWAWLSVFVGLFIGPLIAFGMGSDQ